MTESLELTCANCSHRSICGPTSMVQWLQKVKMLRRDGTPDLELLSELFRSAASRFVCPDCGATGMVAQAVPAEDDESWGMARSCEECKRPIARERLEALPDAKLCANCQGKADRGELTGAPEYCPRCGNPMTIRPSRTTGISRYVLACGHCRS